MSSHSAPFDRAPHVVVVEPGRTVGADDRGVVVLRSAEHIDVLADDCGAQSRPGFPRSVGSELGPGDSVGRAPHVVEEVRGRQEFGARRIGIDPEPGGRLEAGFEQGAERVLLEPEVLAADDHHDVVLDDGLEVGPPRPVVGRIVGHDLLPGDAEIIAAPHVGPDLAVAGQGGVARRPAAEQVEAAVDFENTETGSATPWCVVGGLAPRVADEVDRVWGWWWGRQFGRRSRGCFCGSGHRCRRGLRRHCRRCGHRCPLVGRFVAATSVKHDCTHQDQSCSASRPPSGHLAPIV